MGKHQSPTIKEQAQKLGITPQALWLKTPAGRRYTNKKIKVRWIAKGKKYGWL